MTMHMTTPRDRLLRTLFGLSASADADAVGYGLAWAALALGIVAWLGLGLSPAWSLGVVGASFLGLVACLASRFTAWLPAILGSLALSAIPAVLGMGLGATFHPKHGAWPGALVGLAIGLLVAWPSFRKIIRTVVRPPTSPCP